MSQAFVYESGHKPETQADVNIARTYEQIDAIKSTFSSRAYVRRPLINDLVESSPIARIEGKELATSPNLGSMIFTLILKNERRDSLLYLRVITVLELLRLVGQALEMGPWTHIEISEALNPGRASPVDSP